MRVTVIALLTLFVPCVGYAQGIFSGQRGLISTRTGPASFTIQDAVPPAPLAQDGPGGVVGSLNKQPHPPHGNQYHGHQNGPVSHHCDGFCGSIGDGQACDVCGGQRCCKFKYLHAPRDMVQHLPYDAQPKTYYYFRPYNSYHILLQQRQAMEVGVDPKMPYSNAIFQDVFKKLDPKNQAEQIEPSRSR